MFLRIIALVPVMILSHIIRYLLLLFAKLRFIFDLLHIDVLFLIGFFRTSTNWSGQVKMVEELKSGEKHFCKQLEKLWTKADGTIGVPGMANDCTSASERPHGCHYTWM